MTATFDFEYEADAWGIAGEARARKAAALGEPAETAPAPPVPAEQTPAEPIGPTVAEHAEALIRRRAGRLTVGTVNGYRTHRRGLIKSGIGDRRISDLRKSEVELWISEQVDDGVGGSTINARLKLLRMTTADALAEQLVTRDPATRVADVTVDIKADRTLTHVEEAALLLACPADDDGALAAAVLVALDCGLRWQEVYGLAVDSVAGDFLVIRQVVERATGRIRKYPKGKIPRPVPMTGRVMAALGPVVKAARVRAGADGLLFPSSTGGPMPYESWRRRRWLPAVEGAKLDPAPGFHALRHTYGSRLAAVGIPRSEIAKVMGHADEETTKRYIHEGDDGARRDMVRAALARSAAAAKSTKGTG